jgi:ATP-dependent RNA helicase DHX8/PRP22
MNEISHVQDVRKQLLAIMDRYKLELASAGRDCTRICKAIASGYFFHAARKDAQEGYKSIVRDPAHFIGMS